MYAMMFVSISGRTVRLPWAVKITRLHEVCKRWWVEVWPGKQSLKRYERWREMDMPMARLVLAVSEESGMYVCVFIGCMCGRMHGQSRMLVKWLCCTRVLQVPPSCGRVDEKPQKDRTIYWTSARETVSVRTYSAGTVISPKKFCSLSYLDGICCCTKYVQHQRDQNPGDSHPLILYSPAVYSRTMDDRHHCDHS